MENQINVGDQNNQQIEQNLASQLVQISEKSKLNYLIISIIILIILFFGITGFYVLSRYKSSQTGSNVTPIRPPLSGQKQNSEVFVWLEKTIYQHDDKVFEPIKYSLINNSSRTLYFLSGCAVVLPEVYKIQDGQKTKLQKGAIVCEALPLLNQVSSGGRVELGWNQQNLGKFVEDGQYQFSVEYSFVKDSDYNIGSKLEAVSDVFSINQVVWDTNKQKQICELYGNGFHSNDFFYSKQDCLVRLNN